VIAVACRRDEPEPPEPESDSAVFAKTSLSAPYDGGEVRLLFTTNCPWTLEIPAERENLNGHLHARSGEAGDCEVLFTAFPNVGEDVRSTTFRLSAGRAVAEITLTQEGLRLAMPTEAEVREYLMRLFDECDGRNWRFKGKWGSDLPLNQWGSEVKYENGRLALNLTEHNVKGKVDLSGCAALVSFRAAKNQITEADFSACPLLETVDLTNCGLTDICLEGCLSLKTLNLGYNNLNKISVERSSTLKNLDLSECMLTEINLSGCVSIEDLWLYNNRLRELDIPARQNLQHLWCYGNELKSLDVSGSPWLRVFNCSENEIELLNVADCPRMSVFWCYSNCIASLNLTSMKEWLSDFICYSNRLTSIDLSGFRMLSVLHCSDNQLTALDVTGCIRLSALYCSYNNIRELDFTGLDIDIFRTLDCSYNRMQHADVVSLKRLRHLWCQGNRIGGEIPPSFDDLQDFEYDVRYDYRPESGNYIDRGYGWWYPGEPEKMEHAR